MQRRYGLLLAALAAVAAAYVGYWFFAAGQLREGLAQWAAAQRARGVEVSYGEPRVSGFPWRLIVEVDSPRLALPGHPQQPEWTAARLRALAQPWHLGHVLLDLAGEHRIGFLDDGARRRLLLEVAEGLGSYRAGAAGRPERLSLDLRDVAFGEPGTPRRARAQRVQLHLRPGTLPDVSVEAAVTAESVAVEGFGPMPFGPRIGKAAATVSLVGWIDGGRPAEALAEWRDAGGAVELQRLQLIWGEVAVEGEGTVALDATMRPIGALTARITGQEALIDLAVAEGQMSANAGATAKTALAVLAAANGGVLSVPVRMQDGRLFLGPVAVARLSPIVPDGARNPEPASPGRHR